MIASTTKPDVLLVGSVPRESAEEVFKTCSSILGDHLQALPDGEVGVRKSWIQCQAIGVFDKHPAIETVRRPQSADGLATDYTDNWIFRVRPGIHALEFGDLGYARWAVDSYEVFRELRRQNEIPNSMRFQVSLPTPLAGCATYFDRPGDRELVYRAYEPAIMREASEICRQIPVQDLAIQWDVCIEVLEIASGRTFLDDDPWRSLPSSYKPAMIRVREYNSITCTITTVPCASAVNFDEQPLRCPSLRFLYRSLNLYGYQRID